MIIKYSTMRQYDKMIHSNSAKSPEPKGRQLTKTVNVHTEAPDSKYMESLISSRQNISDINDTASCSPRHRVEYLTINKVFSAYDMSYIQTLFLQR